MHLCKQEEECDEFRVVTIRLDLAAGPGVWDGKAGGIVVRAQAQVISAPGFLRQAAGVSGGHGGLRLLAPLGPES